MTTSEVRVGDALDWEAVEQHLRGVLNVPDEPMAVRQFTNGSANLTYLVRFGSEQFVLRRPPRGYIPAGGHDMHREFRVLSKLNPVYPRAPRAYHFSDDDSVLGAPFVVIEYRDGEVIAADAPESMAHHANLARRLDLALIEAAADLHTVDVDAAGLGDLGRPAGFGERQVSGWRKRWERVAREEDDEVIIASADLLAASLPAPPAVSIVHNDLKLDNCQFQPDDPDTVTSVFDWDMATLGDPLFDLGALVVSMERSPLWVMSRADAVAHYERCSGIDAGDIDWYLAFAMWRTAIVGRQIAYRREGDERYADERGEQGAFDYANRALELLTHRGRDRGSLHGS